MVEAILAFALDPRYVLMHGAARGVDSWADEVGHAVGCRVEPVPVDTRIDGPWPAAGIRRNHRMLDRARKALDLGWEVGVICFWDRKSHGTRDAIDYAARLGLESDIWTPDGKLRPPAGSVPPTSRRAPA
jgi:hypothetical protein